ncbi:MULTISPECIES: LysR family transcriptional regulator [unclassified Pseudomonas]|uniref:LysR family transcriptional regulator n=1 Tax=unclassified Pseudomonas TaxID=196821 RepID=UPI00119B777E|nr:MULTISPECIES: LysR family transcriptional regulator [unclassified Pseudomonas]TWC06595.1 LysR family transcriptional regulator [Pseudomonas sp. SJZ075]TWC11181.1 LysR family transcriptional regulator [Pseudomonas sp. SJZ074]TWC25935.1 LysR family transcriptional regulator [Pseudomonas sp. SJZ078]TWC29653.1 LysR family transcriptional regulator [Pseudomonas sp. SJZ085]TWC45084.1 LysR family transcriptional regulator [Pseudomonas sp. SJZ124]
MDRLQAMQVFRRIVELGGFGKAADDLDLPRATVSLLIQQLEAHLGVQLLQRTTRQVRATLDGEAYYQRCGQLLDDLDDLEGSLSAQRSQPRGTLRVDMPIAFGCHWILPRLADFYRRYPALQLDIGFHDRQVHLQREGVDCAIRAGNITDQALVARPIVRLHQLTCASPDYLARSGTPRQLEDLATHRAISFASGNGRYFPFEFEVAGQVREMQMPGELTVNNADAYVSACEAGFGLIQVPRYHVQRQLAEGRLIQVLSDYAVPLWPISAVYPPHRQLSPRVRVFIDWVIEVLHGEADRRGELMVKI